MPLSMLKRIRDVEIQPTWMTLQLADKLQWLTPWRKAITNDIEGLNDKKEEEISKFS